MFSGLYKSLSIVVSCALVLPPVVSAQQTSSTAPIPPQVVNAHYIFVSNGGGSNYFDIFDAGPNRAYNTFFSQIKRTGHYELVSSPSEADAIFEIRAVAPPVPGLGAPAYNPQVILTIRDPRTNAVLWTASANVRAIGTKKHRDKDFDQSVAVLVDELAQVTGQPLTTAQAKAIDSNSRMSTAAKVFIISSIGAGAGLTAWGLYRFNNPPKLTPPPTPAIP
ncbi:MAG TPA: hypothetical protein VME18_03965 [Acidobacteriaceae bacterium]|nr:hypothetical protein [Acidobacteriaceae bacterium]